MIYVIVFLLVVVLAANFDRHPRTIGGKCSAYIAILLLALLAGMRDVSIGTDTGGYPLYVWKNAVKGYSFKYMYSIEEMEEGYLVFAIWMAKISDSFNYWLFCVHLLIVWCLYKSCCIGGGEGLRGASFSSRCLLFAHR